MSTQNASDTALPPIDVDGHPHDDRGYCYGVEDGMDGYCVHTATCVDAGHASSGPNSSCVKRGQDGPALARARDAAADKRRFTPPEYRERPRGPGGVLPVTDAKQPFEVVALRGRPRVAEGAVSEWSTWEVFEEERESGAKVDFLDIIRRVTDRPRPAQMSPEEAAAVVAEFSARVPHYEFCIVRARLVVNQEVLA